jgi:hypothetical protein
MIKRRIWKVSRKYVQKVYKKGKTVCKNTFIFGEEGDNVLLI